MFNRAMSSGRDFPHTEHDWAAASVGRDSTAAARQNAERLEVWEDEGGSSGRLGSEILRVLIVDNDMVAADALELLLHSSGVPETRVAYSVQGALTIAREFRPAVVLIELNLPDRGSYELGHLLRERAQLERIRLIAVTDSRAHAGRDFARNAGFERYMLKPIVAADIDGLLAPA
jgi:CheY-like chemotaxis protein